MMRHPSLSLGLQLFHRIVQEKVNQDRVDFCPLMLPHYFPPYEFHAPNAAAAQLDLP